MTKKVTKSSRKKKSFQKRLSIRFKRWWENLCYMLETPIRVKEEYDRLTAEIKELEKMQ